MQFFFGKRMLDIPADGQGKAHSWIPMVSPSRLCYHAAEEDWERGVPMKSIGYDLRQALCMGLVIPMFLLPTALRLLGSRGQTPEFSAPERSWDSTQEVGMTDGSTQNLEQYLTCVLLGEIPADFSREALKAQAVAARTYTRKAIQSRRKHDGRLCGDAACCQAYCAVEDFLGRGGTQEALENIRAAVQETDGCVLTYDGDYIEATYFACSGGRTEDAVDVWGVEIPYLQATDSPGEEEARYYREERCFTREELEARLSLVLPPDPKDWVENLTWTEGGGVKEVTLAGQSYAGTELRGLLGLRSASFTVQPEGDGLMFETRGYGHRVGLSQFGADAMAQGGATFREILAHYYPGATLESEPIGESVENKNGM